MKETTSMDELQRLVQMAGCDRPFVNIGTYVAAGANVTNNYFSSDFKPNDARDALSTYIVSADVYRQVVRVAATCRTRQDALERVVPILQHAGGLSNETIRQKAFIEALLPHLTNLEHANYENLRKCFAVLR